MKTDEPHNPYNVPQMADASDVGKPSAAATFLIVVVTVVATLCTFFVTCFGVGVISVETLDGAGIFLALIVGIVAAVAAAKVTGNALHRIFGNR